MRNPDLPDLRKAVRDFYTGDRRHRRYWLLRRLCHAIAVLTLTVPVTGCNSEPASFANEPRNPTEPSRASSAELVDCVRDYGADPTGQTDASGAIQAAINDVPDQAHGTEQLGSSDVVPSLLC